MASRKDLLKAHSFTTARLVSALVDRNPDEAQPPLRRVGTATFVSILLAVVMLAISALFGLLRKQVTADQWQKAGVVIMDSSSGSLFTWDSNTRRLVPMNDITSARLFAASEGPAEMVTVKGADLKGYGQAPLQGIPNAPRQLPLKANIKSLPLRVCATEPNSANQRFLTIQIGDRTPASSGSVDIAAETPNGDQYIVMNGRAHKLEGQGAHSPLIESLPLAKVSETWLASLPVGNPIRRHQVPGAGGRANRGPLIVGHLGRIGDEGSDDVRYYIQLQEGLVRIRYLDMKLMVETGQAQEPTPITSAQYSEAALEDSFGTPDLPFEKPKGPANAGSLDQTSICATYMGGEQSVPDIAVGAPTPTRPANMLHPLGNKADVIEMEPLTGALLQNSNLRGTHTATFLVTNGKIYGIPTMADRRALGYDEKTPLARVPAKLFDLIPDGLPAGHSLSKASVKPL